MRTEPPLFFNSFCFHSFLSTRQQQVIPNYWLPFGIILFLLIGFLNGNAQTKIPDQYFIEHFPPKDYPFGSRVLNLLTDEQGFIWVGTQYGLFRYDGSSFEKIDLGIGDQWTGWYDYQIFCLSEDEEGNIWGFGQGGLFKYNPRKEEVFRPKFRPIGTIGSVLKAESGDVWIGNTSGQVFKLEFPFEQQRDSAVVKNFLQKYPTELYGLLKRMEPDTLVTLNKIGEDQYLRKSFELAEPTELMIVGMGEYISFVDSGYVDHGWLTSESGERLWAMSGEKSFYAGGGSRNQIQVDYLSLPAGKYNLNYISDIGHSYMDWVVDPPDHPEYWGIRLYRKNAGLFSRIEAWNNTLMKKKDFPEGKPYMGVKFHKDDAGQIWIGAFNGLFKVLPNEEGWEGINYRRIKRFPGQEGIVYNIHQLIAGPEGKFWIYGQLNQASGASEVFLDLFDPSEESFTNHYRKEDSLKIGRDVLIYDSERKDFWLANNKGVQKWEKPYSEGPQPVTFRNAKFNNSAICLELDGSGKLWVGNLTGLYKIHPNSSKIRYHELPPTEKSSRQVRIQSFAEDNTGKVWIGTFGDGIYGFDPTSGNIEQIFTPDVIRIDGIPTQSVHVFGDSKGNIWAQGKAGIHLLDTKKKTFTTFRIPDHPSLKLHPRATFRISFEDPEGFLWGRIYTVNTGNTLVKFDPRKTQFILDRVIPNLSGTEVLLDNYGNLWKGISDRSAFRGLAKVHIDSTEKEETTPEILLSSFYQDLFLDPEGMIWVGTKMQGLVLIDPQKGLVKKLTDQDGLISNEVRNILQDDHGNVWLHTATGLTVYHPKKNSFSTPNELKELEPHPSGRGGNFKHSSGAFFIKTEKNGGFYVFHPDEIQVNSIPPKVVITGFQISNKEVPIGEDAPLKQSITFTSELSLSHLQNNISIEYRGLHYDKPEDNQYAYLLEGLDEEWIHVGNEKTARFSKLVPGDYTFLVKAANADGIWSEPTQLSITIHPPWFWSSWSKILYLLALLSGLYSFYLWRTREQRKKLALQEQSLAQEQLLNARLRQIDQLKDQFLANTSHELRTPLHGIIGITESLFEQVGQKSVEDLRQNLGMIMASGRRLASLVNDLLDFSRAKNKDIELQIKSLDLHSITQVVLHSCRPLLGNQPVELINEISKDLPPVLADENRLQQILYNLVGNAIKFTESGYIKIGSRKAESGREHDLIEIFVEDTGIGIPPEKHESIFQSFEQADGDTARAFGGTGLGLSITKQLVELHGGRIWLESKPGNGASFFFTLPVSDKPTEIASPPAAGLRTSVSSPVEKTKEAPVLALPLSGGAKDRIRILVVDDEPINHQVLRNHLSEDQFMITSVMNGREALETIELGVKFDLVLLDVMMPRISGYEVCKKIREKHLPSELPIIMVTAKNQIQDLVEGLSVGANDYLAKPFSRGEFLARVKTQLDLHRINEVTGKFVPNAFLRALGRERITEVALGDHIEREVTVLFSDIRNYMGLAETMTPEQNYRFVNAYNGRMGPIIQAHNGFINQYLGDGIMAIFPEEPIDALNVAIRMQQKIQEYNRERLAVKRQPIRIGIGLHAGPLIMGIIGDEKRLDAATISDTVNTAARLEDLTKHYGVNILLSEGCLDQCQKNLKRSLHFRYLGQVQVKGRQAPVGVYECIDGDHPDIARRKWEMQAPFEAGMHYFFQQEFAEASAIFNKILKVNPGDTVARLFLGRAAHFIQHGVPEKWEGIEKMNIP